MILNLEGCMLNPVKKVTVLAFVLSLVAAACSGDPEVEAAGPISDPDTPTVVVTTSILGDVVQNLVGDQMDVEVIMPAGADPHDFQASAQQVASIGEAEVVITNGANFEEGLIDLIDTAAEDGVLVYEAISAVDTLEFDAEHGHDDEHGDEADEEHGDDKVEDEDHDESGHGGDTTDPHFFTDPARVASAAAGIATFLAENVSEIDGDALTLAAGVYGDELIALDAEVEATLSAVAEDDRILVTNHEVFAYFADRYNFEVVGTIIPATTTGDAVSAQELSELAEVIKDADVAAVFADTSSSNELAETLAAEVGEVAVVELFSESLGDADSDGATYVDMVRSNAERVAAALSV